MNEFIGYLKVKKDGNHHSQGGNHLYLYCYVFWYFPSASEGLSYMFVCLNK